MSCVYSSGSGLSRNPAHCIETIPLPYLPPELIDAMTKILSTGSFCGVADGNTTLSRALVQTVEPFSVEIDTGNNA
jgi:hypothetical protein